MAPKVLMKHIAYLKNTIQEYAWGSRTAIAELMGQASPTDRPQAELWLGAHPKAPSLVHIDNEWVSLSDVIQVYPIEIMGKKAAKKFNARLPFLLKILAAARPLSIQAHPDADAAQEGYAREETAGIPFEAPDRNYKDPHHKPECLCALTNFWGLCGFRKVSETLALLNTLCPKSLHDALEVLEKASRDKGLEVFLQTIMCLSPRDQARVVREAVRHAQALRPARPEFDWIVRLQEAYPSDIGAIFPAILNLVYLQPGQALFLKEGELHAYLDGVGIELMANSDNVLRGGLTSKHVDVDELMHILSFEEKQVDILAPENREAHVRYYRTPAEEFELSVLALDNAD